MAQELTGAEEIEVESFEKDSIFGKEDRTDSLEVDRWTKHGHDRLYINEGISKASKYKLHVDLQTHEIRSNNETKHSGGSVEINGDTAVVTIEESKGKKEHTVVLNVEWDDDE